jgi:hypothetical protein
VRKVAIFVGFYLVLALVIGLAYSWAWAAAVILMGLIPAGAMWFLADRYSESYLEWGKSEAEGRDRYTPRG